MRCKTCGNSVGFLSWLLDKMLHGKSHDCVDIEEISKINEISDDIFVKESISVIPDKNADFEFISERDRVLGNRPKIQITISRDDDILLSLYSYDCVDKKILSSHLFLNNNDITDLINKLKYVSGKI